MATMRLEIATAERVVYSEDVDLLVAPGMDGQLAVLPNHAPLMTALLPGELRVVKDGEDAYMAVGGGFLEVMANSVAILADTAEREEEIDIARAEQAIERAKERIETSASEMDLQRAVASLRRSQARLLAASHRRRRNRGEAPVAPPPQPQ